MHKPRTCILFVLLACVPVFGPHPYSAAHAQTPAETRYLAFQIFTAAPDPAVPLGGSGADPLPHPPSKDGLRRAVSSIIDAIGTTGTPTHKLAFVVGPLALDHTEAQLQTLIHDAFALALELDIAVGFHIDDSMFWARRTDLAQDPANIEWLDWDGTPNTGRRLDWSAEPLRIAPQVCVNSPGLQAAVRGQAAIIGGALADGVALLQAQGRAALFAGVIAGWETQIGRDYATGQYLGYCALTNLGYSAAHPPADHDAALVQVVQDFIGLWADALAGAGVDPSRIYAHIALTSTATYAAMQEPRASYARINHYALPSVTFSAEGRYRPGFSTYPQVGLMPQLYETLGQHGSPAWASAEGANIRLDLLNAGGSMETYLAWMFNHGAALVNVFGWGVGRPSEPNPFRDAAQSPDAVAAYRKFLAGEPLAEEPYTFSDLPTRIQRIQADLPGWLPEHPGRQAHIAALMGRLQAALQTGDLPEASRLADEILAIIGTE